jgi:kynurenine formamidase
MLAYLSKKDSKWERHAGVSRDATEWLLDQGIKLVGTDAFGWDNPFSSMIETYKAGKTDSLWPSHFFGREREYCQIEKLGNLEKLPKPTGFKIAVFPILIERASAGWCRAVAILEE